MLVQLPIFDFVLMLVALFGIGLLVGIGVGMIRR